MVTIEILAKFTFFFYTRGSVSSSRTNYYLEYINRSQEKNDRVAHSESAAGATEEHGTHSSALELLHQQSKSCHVLQMYHHTLQRV